MRVPGLPPEGDTIAAVATPPGVGGIGIVRISGPEAERICRALFRPGKAADPSFPSHRLLYGHIHDPRDASIVDEVLVVLMRAPRTYTREDVVEIHCHGGPQPVRRILDCVVAQGARPASPGEFTLRAFLNGRIDLVQAEAVLDVVSAKSSAALRFAAAQLDGALSGEVRRVRDVIKAWVMEVEAWLDFPEEDLAPPDFSTMRRRLEEEIRGLRELEASYRHAHLYRDGVRVVICGRPNVGKSTLLNLLAGRRRAIVSPRPGTTRDFLEEEVSFGGIPARLIDTAGLREDADEVEAMGVEIARDQIENADLLLYLIDASRPRGNAEALVPDSLPPDRTLVVWNKIDLVGREGLEATGDVSPPFPTVAISALRGMGLDRLRDEVFRLLTREEAAMEARAVVTNVRHRDALSKCREALEGAAEQLRSEPVAGDLLAADLRHALAALGTLLGETTPEEILRGIFEAFCIGK